jgi:hypothetical protein
MNQVVDNSLIDFLSVSTQEMAAQGQARPFFLSERR